MKYKIVIEVEDKRVADVHSNIPDLEILVIDKDELYDYGYEDESIDDYIKDKTEGLKKCPIKISNIYLKEQAID